MHSIRHVEDSTFESIDPNLNIWVDPNQIRRIQLIQMSNLPCVKSNDLIRRMEYSTFELGLSGTSLILMTKSTYNPMEKFTQRIHC